MSILYRGFRYGCLPGVYRNEYLDKPRPPRDTPLQVHLAADEWFYAKFNYRFRSQVLFCYGQIKPASQYGEVGIIEPIGDHVMCWSPKICDMFGAYMEEHVLTLEEMLNEADYIVFTINDIDIVKVATQSEHEIMLWCENFSITKAGL